MHVECMPQHVQWPMREVYVGGQAVRVTEQAMNIRNSDVFYKTNKLN